MITWRGFSYALLIILVYLILAYSGFSLLFVLFFVLLLLPPLSIIQHLISSRYLIITQQLALSDIERGDPARLFVQLQQKGWLSHGELDLIIRKPGPRGQVVFERHRQPLLAGIPVELTIEIECRHRGQYQTGVWSVRSRDILGIFYLPVRSHRTCRQQLQLCRILPRPELIPGSEDLSSLLADWQHQQTLHFGDEIDTVANLRAHRPGDSMKRTHWKVSARLDQIMIKEFENPIQREGLLVLDLNRSGRHSGSRHASLELGDFFMDRAAFLIKLSLETGNHLRIVTYQTDGRHEHLTNNLNDLRAMQYVLTEFGWTDGWPADQVLADETAHGQPAWFVLLLTTHLDENIARQLQALQNRGSLTWLFLIDDQPDDSEQSAAVAMLEAQQVPCVRIRRSEAQSHDS